MRLTFTIRDLLWLMIVVALAMAWWGDTPTKNTPRYVVHYEGDSARPWIDDRDTGQIWVLDAGTWKHTVEQSEK
jgi:hypothetical protein